MPLLILATVAFFVWLISKNGSGAQQTSLPAPSGDGGSTPEGQSYSGGNDVADYSLSSIVKAVQQVETGGRQVDSDGDTIVSRAGAIGIMQLEPGTAADLGVDPYDEAQNIDGGTRYLEQLFTKFGDWFTALAAYNWGQGHVNQADAAGIPYPTSVQDYARNVLAIAGRNGQ